MTYQQLIKKWRIGYPELVAEMNKHVEISLSQFKKKISVNHPYEFTDTEQKALLKAINQLKKDIEKI